MVIFYFIQKVCVWGGGLSNDVFILRIGSIVSEITGANTPPPLHETECVAQNTPTGTG